MQILYKNDRNVRFVLFTKTSSVGIRVLFLVLCILFIMFHCNRLVQPVYTVYINLQTPNFIRNNVIPVISLNLLKQKYCQCYVNLTSMNCKIWFSWVFFGFFFFYTKNCVLNWPNICHSVLLQHNGFTVVISMYKRLQIKRRGNEILLYVCSAKKIINLLFINIIQY